MSAHPVTVVGVFGLMAAGATYLFHAVARGWDIARIRLAPAKAIGSTGGGRVALSGRAEARAEIVDPVFGDPCVWWRCVVEDADSDSSRLWRDIAEATSTEPFTLRDGTGAVVIAPQGAECHLPQEEGRVVELTLDNHDDLAPLLRSWGVWYTGGRVRLIGSLGFTIMRALRIKVQTLRNGAPVSVVGSLTALTHDDAEGKRRLADHLKASKREFLKTMEAEGGDAVRVAQEWEAHRVRVETELRSESAARGASSARVDGRFVMSKGRNEPFVLSSQPPSTLPFSLEFRAAGRALVGVLLIGFGYVHARLFAYWGFWPAHGLLRPLAAAATGAGLVMVWLLKDRRRGW